mgnify:CR=1 FL=1
MAKKTNYNQIITYGGLLIAFVAFWFLLSLGIVETISNSPDSTTCATQLSTAFAGVSALFSGLAFAGLIISLYHQNKQIGSQAKQFKTQNTQFQQQFTTQKSQFEKQAETQNTQFQQQFTTQKDQFEKHAKTQKIHFEQQIKAQKTQFDKQFKTQVDQFNEQTKRAQDQQAINTIFQLLNLHHEIVKELRGKDLKIETVGEIVVNPDKESEEIPLTGRACFEPILKKVNSAVGNKMLAKKASLSFDDIRQVYKETHEVNHSTLAHYLRNLYHIFKYIKYSSGLDETQQQNYASIVSAQLTSYELGLMFYNSFEFEKSEKLYLEYGVFEQFGVKQTIESEEIIHCFNCKNSQTIETAYPGLTKEVNNKLRNQLETLLKQAIATHLPNAKINIVTVFQDLIRRRVFTGTFKIETEEDSKKRVLNGRDVFVYAFSADKESLSQQQLESTELEKVILDGKIKLIYEPSQVNFLKSETFMDYLEKLIKNGYTF